MLVCMADHLEESRGEISKNVLMERMMQHTIASKSKDLMQSKAWLKKFFSCCATALVNQASFFLPKQ